MVLLCSIKMGLVTTLGQSDFKILVHIFNRFSIIIHNKNISKGYSMKITSSAMGGETGLRTLAKAGLNSLKNYFKDSYGVGNGYGGFLLGGLPTAAAVTGLGINYALQTSTSPMDFWVKTLVGLGVGALSSAPSSKIATEAINILRLKPIVDNYKKTTQIEMTEREKELLGDPAFAKAFSDAMNDFFDRATKEERIRAQMIDNLGKLSEERAPINDNPNKISHEEAVKKVENKAKDRESMSFIL